MVQSGYPKTHNFVRNEFIFKLDSIFHPDGLRFIVWWLLTLIYCSWNTRVADQTVFKICKTLKCHQPRRQLNSPTPQTQSVSHLAKSCLVAFGKHILILIESVRLDRVGKQDTGRYFGSLDLIHDILPVSVFQWNSQDTEISCGRYLSSCFREWYYFLGCHLPLERWHFCWKSLFLKS